MKKIIAVMLVLLFATSAYAVDVELTGDFHTRGRWIGNFAFADDNEATYTYYDQDCNITAKLIASEDSSVTIKTAIRDQSWTGAAASMEEMAPSGQKDDNIDIERAFLTHKFASGTTLVAGLMNGRTWGGISFADDEDSFYRLKLIHEVANGIVLGYIQKTDEQGNSQQVEDGEADDSDAYAVGTVLKFDDINFAANMTYQRNSATAIDQGSDGTDVISIDIASHAELGSLGYEAELMYMSASSDDSVVAGDEYDVFGIYAKIYGKISDTMEVGGWLAYGSVDDDNGAVNGAFDFDDDFDSGLIMGDQIQVNGGDDLAGCTAIELYGTFGLMDGKCDITPSLMYVMSNVEDDERTWIELDVEGSYKLTEFLTYSFGIGFVNHDSDDAFDEGMAMMMEHKLKLAF